MATCLYKTTENTPTKPPRIHRTKPPTIRKTTENTPTKPPRIHRTKPPRIHRTKPPTIRKTTENTPTCLYKITENTPTDGVFSVLLRHVAFPLRCPYWSEIGVTTENTNDNTTENTTVKTTENTTENTINMYINAPQVWYVFQTCLYKTENTPPRIPPRRCILGGVLAVLYRHVAFPLRCPYWSEIEGFFLAHEAV